MTSLQEARDAESLNAIFEMFEASVDGQLYDVERFVLLSYGVDAPVVVPPRS